MEKTKLIMLLKTLDKPEIERFSLFLSSPIFNERETLAKLFDEVKLYYPEFEDPEFTKEMLFKRLYKDRIYNDELMRNMISRVCKQLENYLSFINYEKDDFNRQYRLLEELSSRGLEKIFRKQFELGKKNCDGREIIDLGYFSEQYWLSCISLEHFFSYPYQPDVDLNILKERENRLTEYFLADLLNVYNMIIHDLTLHPEKKYSLSLVNEVTGYFEKNPKVLEGNHYLHLNYSVLMLLLTQNDNYFTTARNLLNGNSQMFTKGEKSKHYIALLSYLQSKIFKGDQSKLRDKFELYKEFFANEGAYKNDTIRHADLILAVNCGLMLKEYNAAEELISRYVDEVEVFYRKSTRLYCLALIYYYKKNYNLAISNLSKVEYDNISYKLMVRTLSLMIYFSKNDPEGFYSLVDSFRHFLSINKNVSHYQIKVTSNFINFTAKLFKGREDLTKFDIKGFKKELTVTPDVGKKQWLVEMAEEIENKSKTI